ncbi:MAG: DUF4011 domain-containing protein [Pseudonocardiaceae bacterium]
MRNRARQLRNRLRALDEEQGVQAGYLAHGLVEWQTTDSGRTLAASRMLAPLLLYPVTLHARTAAESDYDLELIGDVDLNQVLLHALHRYHGVDPSVAQPVLDRLSDTDDPTMRMHSAYERLAGIAAAAGVELALRPATVMGSSATTNCRWFRTCETHRSCSPDTTLSRPSRATPRRDPGSASKRIPPRPVPIRTPSRWSTSS